VSRCTTGDLHRKVRERMRIRPEVFAWVELEVLTRVWCRTLCCQAIISATSQNRKAGGQACVWSCGCVVVWLCGCVFLCFCVCVCGGGGERGGYISRAVHLAWGVWCLAVVLGARWLCGCDANFKHIGVRPASRSGQAFLRRSRCGALAQHSVSRLLMMAPYSRCCFAQLLTMALYVRCCIDQPSAGC
jgi:hypothetical protein